MDINDILHHCDHTVLSVSATWNAIREAIDDAIAYEAASVCIPPSYVKAAHEYAAGRVGICTVIGFPNGYSASDVKAYEARRAVEDGAWEIDMVINVGMLKDGKYDQILSEINEVKRSIGNRILKVIIEACLLTDDEKITMCRIVSESDANFIKTSTGFSSGGATAADVRILCENVTGGTLVKAAGGIATLGDAEEFLKIGASRLGTSRIVSIAKKEASKSSY